MGPADLLCKWCSTFVGKDKKFCSIFCESRYTRSKRRKLAFKRPAHSSGPHADREYESPRSHNTAPSRKFLEDVITAVETEKPSPERDRRRLQYSAREADEVGYCHFCCRQLYFTDALFCDRACENRKRQLSWKSANIELPKAKKNRYVWSSQPPAYRDRLQQPHTNFTRYIPSWDMYEAKA
ncbi:uncharacterized protein LOC128219568 isoform X2 [Mya arenaria]|uniref:uncharacterized protein LOC128219568 isoform X2 n=1 Tax=Mya arenaria TaxID=6604 RepID=UPI0022E3F91B|nr:uncharacterized protein LOC128219568 isoform X2 [Mya arenaria]